MVFDEKHIVLDRSHQASTVLTLEVFTDRGLPEGGVRGRSEEERELWGGVHVFYLGHDVVAR